MNLPIQKYGKTERRKFGKINEVIDIPDLVEIQKESYKTFIEEGIGEVFEDFSPITDYSDHFELYFLDHEFGSKPKYDEKECRNRDATYALPLRVKVRLVNKVKEEVIDQEVFMGDFPLMTENGSFIINGAERVIVSQLVRSPGSYNEAEPDKTPPEIRRAKSCLPPPSSPTAARGWNSNRTARASCGCTWTERERSAQPCFCARSASAPTAPSPTFSTTTA